MPTTKAEVEIKHTHKKNRIYHMDQFNIAVVYFLSYQKGDRSFRETTYFSAYLRM